MTRRRSELWNRVAIPPRVALRAYERAQRNEQGCWISNYSVASHGYAQIGWQSGGVRHVVLAHRAAFVHVNGQMPIGMTLDHLCKVRACVNPEHLRMLPNFENARRNRGNDWPLGTCGRGHSNEALVEISRRSKNGAARTGFTCGTCLKEGKRAWAEKNPDRIQAARQRWKKKQLGES